MLPICPRIQQAERRILHVAERKDVGAVRGQHSLRFTVACGPNQAGTAGVDARLNAIGDELIKNGIRRQGPVLADFFRQFSGLAGEGLDPFGQLRLFLTLDLHFLLHVGNLLGGDAFFGLGDLKLAG